MPIINLLSIETRGVDMRTNPLLLDKKLHAGTNLVFEEGVIKTRPGFRYKTLGCSGQFQGAGEFRPRRGLSAAPLSESKSGLVVVVGGEIWMNCKKIGDAFEGQGEVNIFQAENYLILQNNNSSTFWWDGETLTESPGMQETDWDEVETPVQDLEIVAPVAVIPECSFENSQGGVTTTFTVRHLKTGRSISGALITVFKGTNRVAKGRTKADGTLVLNTAPGAYTYTVTSTGFIPLGSTGLISNGTGTLHEWDTCVAPTLVVTGNNLVDVRLDEIVIPDNPEDNCFTIATQFVTPVVANLRGRITLTNNSIAAKNVNTLTLTAGATHNAILPLTVAPGSSVTINVFSPVTITNTPISIKTDCNDVDWVFNDNPEILYVRLVYWNAVGENEGHYTYQIIQIPYSPPTSVYRGVSEKGAFTIEYGTWPEAGIGTADAVGFKISFDVATEVTGSGYAPEDNATYKPRYGPQRYTEVIPDGEVAGSYTFSIYDNGHPFPDWTAQVSHTPLSDNGGWL